MTDGIDPTRLRRDTGYVETTEPAPARRTASRPLPDLTDLPEASFGPLPHVRRDVSVQRTADPPKTPVQMRLDAFMASTTPEYTVDGKSVRVPIPFRMTVDVRKLPVEDQWRRQEEKVVVPHSGELKAAAASVGLGDARHLALLRSGRATPEEVQKVTQALIDRGRLPNADGRTPDAVSRVRSMMFDYGLGIDCAGYTQQAYLESRGVSRGQTHLKGDILNEDLTNLAREGFQKVPIDEARSGDILVLDPPVNKPPPGHTLIVYERREPTADELAALRRAPGFGAGHVTVYVVDSSFGSFASAQDGGVMRQIWWRNDNLKNWARRDPGDPNAFEVSFGTLDPKQPARDVPYDGHLIRGFYRPGGETP